MSRAMCRNRRRFCAAATRPNIFCAFPFILRNLSFDHFARVVCADVLSSRRYCPVEIVQQGGGQCIFPYGGAFLRDQNRTIPFGTIVLPVPEVLLVLVAQEGSALWGNTLATALLHDLNWTIPFGLIVLCPRMYVVYARDGLFVS